MVVNTNINSINANRMMRQSTESVGSTMEKLASGLRINRAKDDPAGLAVSERLRTQARGIEQATRNARDGISFIETAEGYYDELSSILVRLRELSLQSANDVYTETDRLLMQGEVNQLVSEVDRIAQQAEFNGLSFFSGFFAEDRPFSVHVGPNSDQNISSPISALSSEVLSLRTEGVQGEEGIARLTSIEEANQMIATLDTAIDTVISQRVALGTFQVRLESVIRSNETGYQNLRASDSRIRDADMAEYISRLTQETILQQANIAVLSQANSNAQNVLSLLS